MRAVAIIGSNFGDEGKGLMTSYFADKLDKSLVVRFNGGAQAGHTVCDKKTGKRTVFHHIGSGALEKRPTYLNENFIVNPLVFKKEWEETKPIVFISGAARVTLPYDIIINQEIEKRYRHGSCGLGINETVKRAEAKHGSYMFHMGSPGLVKLALKQYKNTYLNKRLKQLPFEISPEAKDLIFSENIEKQYIDSFMYMFDRIDIGGHYIYDQLDINNVIFEGAQGLLLDEKSEYFPHVTRSRTGSTNLVEEAKKFESLHVVYVSRAYTTRHGNGPFPWANDKKYNDPTNKPNEFQGTLRFGYLDLNELKKQIQKDLDENPIPNRTYSVAITCLDQVDKNTRNYILENEAGLPIQYHSFGPCKEDVVELSTVSI